MALRALTRSLCQRRCRPLFTITSRSLSTSSSSFSTTSFPRSPLSPNSSSSPLPSLSSLPSTSLSAVYAEPGPLSSIHLLPVHLPSSLPPSSLLLRFLAAPLNPSDTNTVEGTYPIQPPTYPATAGNEGVAEVVQTSDPTSSFRPGDWVNLRRPAFGTWREWAVASVDEVERVPAGLTLHQAAVLSVNPCTALRLLSDFASLPPQSIVVQNASTSAVGQCVTQIARILGHRTIDIIRGRPTPEATQQTVDHLKALGSGGVVVDEEGRDMGAQLRELTGGKKVRLALNAVGGSHAAALFRVMEEGGVIATYGGMSKRPLQVPTGQLIFHDVKVVGFWMSRWNERATEEERREMRETVGQWMREGKLTVEVEEFPLSDLTGAIRRSQESHKMRKTLLRC